MAEFPYFPDNVYIQVCLLGTTLAAMFAIHVEHCVQCLLASVHQPWGKYSDEVLE